MKRIILGLIAAFWLHLPAFAEAPLLGASDLLTKAGLDAQLEALPDSIKVGLAEALSQGLPLLEEKRRIVEQGIDQAYAPDRIRSMLSERIEGMFSADEQEALVGFLDSPLGKRIVEAEAALADEEVIRDLMRNAPQLVSEATKNTVRLGLIQAINEAVKGTERGVNTAIHTGLAIDIAFMNTEPGREKPSMENLIKIHEQNRIMLTPLMAQFVLASSMSAYKSFTDSEMGQYLEFVLSPEGQKFFNGMSDELDKVLIECGRDLGRIVAERSKKAI